ncbi:hypothetical protein F5B18DRAFT_556257 [Nemania serpens]|nr:hypothetical protein F5B18DRAFT_556257 [Nemania serpens]
MSSITTAQYYNRHSNPSVASSSNAQIPRSELIATDKLWPSDKDHLYVYFMNGSTEQQRLVKYLVIIHYNSLHLGIQFMFLSKGDINRSDIRFEFSNESWSYLGKDAQAHPYETTMTVNMKPKEGSHDANSMKIQADILHEFGHALGMVHAHKHPDCKVNRDYPRVSSRWGWSEEEFRRAVDKDTPSVIGKKWDLPYDPYSIMHYSINKGDTYSRVAELTENTVLSDGDKKMLLRRYPKRREGGETGTRTESRRTTTDRSRRTMSDTLVSIPEINQTVRRDRMESVVTPRKEKHDYKPRECSPVHVTGNGSTTVQGGYVRVSGNATVRVQGGGLVVVSEHSCAIVYGDSDVRVRGNGSVYVYGNGTAVVSENGSAGFSGLGTGKTSGNGTLRSYV